MIDLEAVAVARASVQLRELRFDGGQEPDGWAIRGARRCIDCGEKIDRCSPGALCRRCKRARRRATCWACNEPAEVKGYCRRHAEHIRSAGVVDPLHFSAGEGHGAPKGGRFA